MLGQARRFDPLAKLGDLGLIGVLLAELLLDRLHLLAQDDTRAGPCRSPDWTWDWIFEPSWITSASRARISESRRSRLVTSTSSRSSCFSAVAMRRAPAIRCESADGSSMFVTASASSSGRYGISSMISVNERWTLRVSASSS